MVGCMPVISGFQTAFSLGFPVPRESSIHAGLNRILISYLALCMTTDRISFQPKRTGMRFQLFRCVMQLRG